MAKLYVAENGSERMVEMLQRQSPGSISISRLAIVEATSALVRRARQREFSEDDLNAALNLLNEDVIEFHVLEVGGAVVLRAVGLIRKHALRAADAIHLASALVVRAEKMDSGNFLLISSDRELNAAAEREDLTVVDPAAG